MKLKIIGSGGCVSIPKPCCNCRVCTEAREKGFPYARTGCSLYIEDEQILIDTPEDINYALNNARVNDVSCVLYSHIDPDHTMGMRVFEQLRLNWLKKSIGEKPDNPIQVSTLPQILDDLKMHRTKYGSLLEYYEHSGLVKLKPGNQFTFHTISIELVPVDQSNTVTIFVITDGNMKVIYAPCDVKPFPDSKLFYNADTLIIGNTVVGNVLKGGFIVKKNNPLLRELFIMDEIVALKEKYNINRVIITHIEEDWGKTYDDYKEIEKNYEGIQFAYDGMEVMS